MAGGLPSRWFWASDRSVPAPRAAGRGAAGQRGRRHASYYGSICCSTCGTRTNCVMVSRPILITSTPRRRERGRTGSCSDAAAGALRRCQRTLYRPPTTRSTTTYVPLPLPPPSPSPPTCAWGLGLTPHPFHFNFTTLPDRAPPRWPTRCDAPRCADETWRSRCGGAVAGSATVDAAGAVTLPLPLVLTQPFLPQ